MSGRKTGFGRSWPGSISWRTRIRPRGPRFPNHPPRQIPIPIPTFALVLVQDSLVSVKEVVEAHWLTYGRNYYTRYDYEGLEKAKGDAVMSHLRSNVIPSAAGQSFGPGMTIEKAEEFAYTDPIDGSVSTQQVRRRDPTHLWKPLRTDTSGHTHHARHINPGLAL